MGRNSVVFYAVHFPVMVVAAKMLRSGATPSGLELYLSIVLLAGLAERDLRRSRPRVRTGRWRTARTPRANPRRRPPASDPPETEAPPPQP